MVIQRYLVPRELEQLLKTQQGGVYISPPNPPLTHGPIPPPLVVSEVQVKSEVQVRGMVKIKKSPRKHDNGFRDQY